MTDVDPALHFASEVLDETEDFQNSTVLENIMYSIIKNMMWFLIIYVVIFMLSLLGLLGNGKVIWILGFHLKRNSFTTYILNLAVADSGVLIAQLLKLIFLITSVYGYLNIYPVCFYICVLFYNTSQLLLISISTDRCVSIIFPIWHHCHRPPKLSCIVCSITWILPILLLGFNALMVYLPSFLLVPLEFLFVLTGLICYPVMVISTLILLIKVFKQPQRKKKRILRATLLSLLCFITFRLPLSIFSAVLFFIMNDTEFRRQLSALDDISETDIFQMSRVLSTLFPWFHSLLILFLMSEIGVTVNSSINPILYFLAGRKKEDRSQISMKQALQRVFRNEENSMEVEEQSQETHF